MKNVAADVRALIKAEMADSRRDLSLLTSPATRRTIFQAGSKRLALSLVNPMDDENLVGRFTNWIKGIELYLAKPILGTGLRGIETPWGLDKSEILNYFLFNLLSYGVLGFLGIMTVHFRLLTAYWRGIQLGDRITAMLCIASIGAMLGFFLGVQPQDPYSTVIIWAPLLIAFAASTQQRNRIVLDSGSKIAMNQNSHRDLSKG